MRIELERYLDRVYRMADSIGEGSLSVNKWPSSINEGSLSVNKWPSSINEGSLSVNKWPSSISEGSLSVNKWPSSINEGSLSVNKWPSSIKEGSSSSTRFVYLMLWSSKSDLTRKRSVHCNPLPKSKHGVRGDSLVKDQMNQRASLLHSNREWKNFLRSVSR